MPWPRTLTRNAAGGAMEDVESDLSQAFNDVLHAAGRPMAATQR